jgi:hypothetical protein
MELWTSTQKTILAAAFGTMGVIVRHERSYDEKTGAAQRTFHLAPSCVQNLVKTNTLKRSYVTGELLREHPEHPILDICYAKQNRDRLLDAVNKGQRIQLVKQKGANRTFYERGEGTSFPGVTPAHQHLLATKDLNIVSAFARFGVPVLKVEGPRGQRKFFLDAFQRLTTPGNEFAGDILKQWRAKELHDEHPFGYAVLGLINYARLVRSMESEVEQVLIRKPNSIKSAIVDPKIKDHGLDKMRRFFLG